MLIEHERAVGETVAVIIHIITVKQERAVLGILDKIVPLILVGGVVPHNLELLGQVFAVIIDVARCIIRVRCKHHADRPGRKITQVTPYSGRDQDALTRRIHSYLSLMSAVIDRHRERARYGNNHLGRFAMRVTSATLAVGHSIDPEYAFNLKRNLMSALRERQRAAVIGRLRKFYNSASTRELLHFYLFHNYRKDNGFFLRMLFFQK